MRAADIAKIEKYTRDERRDHTPNEIYSKENDTFVPKTPDEQVEKLYD